MNDVLITGGAGFIGSNLANALTPMCNVTVVDNFFMGEPSNLNDKVNILDLDVIHDDLPTDVDVVYHLAALSSYGMHENDVIGGLRTNVEGFVNTCLQALNDGCEQIVYASTSSVYGDRVNMSPEYMTIEARTAYEASKLSRERYAEYFSNYHGMNMAGMRFFSVYQGYEGNEEHKEEYANVIAQFLHDMRNGDRPVLYGDGTQTRDFIHVSDVVVALIAAADNHLDGIYNVGTGEQFSFNYIVELINEELDTDIEPKYVENPIPERVYVNDTIADISKLAAETDWEPSVNIREGIRRVCKR